MDQQNNQQEIIEHKDNHTKETHKKGKFLGLINGIIGGVVSAIIIVVLLANNLIPIGQAEVISSTNTTNNTNTIPISDMITEEDQNPTSIDEVSKAIVGIVNLQQRDIWTPNQTAGTGS